MSPAMYLANSQYPLILHFNKLSRAVKSTHRNLPY
jgi:hypothetical protein